MSTQIKIVLFILIFFACSMAQKNPVRGRDLLPSAKDTINAFIEDSLDSSGIIDWDQLNDSAKDSIRQIISDSLSAHDALILLNDSLYYFDYPKSVDDNPIYYWWVSSQGYIYILVDSLGNGTLGDPEAVGMMKVDSLGDGSLHQASGYIDNFKFWSETETLAEVNADRTETPFWLRR